ncbi:hypothetical protein GCM10010286_16560 [Streptomyces toxytricini]|nr:hypothetical protein GCM10010286_16560 [Streptomyces toxytricini]
MWQALGIDGHWLFLDAVSATVVPIPELLPEVCAGLRLRDQRDSRFTMPEVTPESAPTWGVTAALSGIQSLQSLRP